MLGGLGWPLADPGVEIMYRSPVDIYIDEWVHELLETVERTERAPGPHRQPHGPAERGYRQTRFREFMYSLIQRFSRQGISMLTTYETPGLPSDGEPSEFALSHLADNLITLDYHRDHERHEPVPGRHQDPGQQPRPSHPPVQHQPRRY